MSKLCADEKVVKSHKKGSVKQINLKKRLRIEKFFLDFYGKMADHIEGRLISIKKSKVNRRHLDQRIRDAETFEEREEILRDLAAFCYRESKAWKAKGDPRMQKQWVKLIARFFELSGKFAEKVRLEEEIEDLKKKFEALKDEEPPQVP